MNNAKPWYLSKTIWAGLVTALATLIKNFYGLDLTDLIGQIGDYVLATVQFIGLVSVIIGRVKATQPIHPTILGRIPPSANGLLLLACVGAVCALSHLPTLN